MLAYTLLIALVAVERVAELVVSQRNLAWSRQHGGVEFGGGRARRDHLGGYVQIDAEIDDDPGQIIERGGFRLVHPEGAIGLECDERPVDGRAGLGLVVRRLAQHVVFEVMDHAVVAERAAQLEQHFPLGAFTVLDYRLAQIVQRGGGVAVRLG